MKITRRELSRIDVLEEEVKTFIKTLKNRKGYEKFYLDIVSKYEEDFKPSFVDVETFIENHNNNNPCDAIINEEGEIEYALPTHDIAMFLAYPKMTEDEYCLACYNILEYTGFVKVYNDYIYTPSYITASQYNTIMRLVESKCISYRSDNLIKTVAY